MAPGLLCGGGIMCLLPLAQLIDAAPEPAKPPIQVAYFPVPILEDVPEPPPDEPIDDPVPDLEDPPEFPDPFVIETVPNLNGVNRYSNDILVTYDPDEFNDDIAEWADLTAIPQPLSQPEPQYPSALRSSRIEGSVRIRFLIRADGSVSRITVLDATHQLFGDAAAKAVRHWRFHPGERHGRPVAVWALQSIPFKIH